MDKDSGKLTKRQEEAFWLLSHWMEENNKNTATYEELSSLFGVSVGSANYILTQLCRRGYIKRQSGRKAAEIKILKKLEPEELLDIPIIGAVSNEIPLLFENPLGTVKITPGMAKGKTIFAMKLIEVPPKEEDAVMLFRKWQYPCNGSTVLVEYNGKHMISKIKISTTELWLAPRAAPKSYVRVSPDDSLRFIAILLSILRNRESSYQ